MFSIVASLEKLAVQRASEISTCWGQRWLNLVKCLVVQNSPIPGEKAIALGFSLIKNHPFVDGNKRVGRAAMEVFLVLNGYETKAPIEEQKQAILDVAAGKMSRESFIEWLAIHVIERDIL